MFFLPGRVDHKIDHLKMLGPVPKFYVISGPVNSLVSYSTLTAMKNYGSSIFSATELAALAVPVGAKLPVDPKDGELFHLTQDYPEPSSGDLPWFSKGLYRAQDKGWIRLADERFRSSWGVIGACSLEIEEASSTKDEPVLGQGYVLTDVRIQPAHRQVIMTGTGSFWVEAEKDCHAWATIFRQTEPFIAGYEEVPPGAPAGFEPAPLVRNYVMVAFVGMRLSALTATPVSITFVDIPATDQPVDYVLQINSDRPGFLSINQCSAFRFNGASSTALIVSQAA